MFSPDLLLSRFGSLDLESCSGTEPAPRSRSLTVNDTRLNVSAKPFIPSSLPRMNPAEPPSDLAPPTLPIELLYHLSTFVNSRQTLRLLCLVNSTFLEIALPLLYRRLEMRSGTALKGILSMPNPCLLPSLAYLHPRLSLDQVAELTMHLPLVLASPLAIHPIPSTLPKLTTLNLFFSTLPHPYASSPSRRSGRPCPLTALKPLLFSLKPQAVSFCRSGDLTDRVLVLPLLAETLSDLLKSWTTPSLSEDGSMKTLCSLTYGGVLLDPQHVHRSVSSSFFPALIHSPERRLVSQTWDLSSLKRREDVLMTVELVKEGWLELDDGLSRSFESDRGRWTLILRRDQENWVKDGWGGQGGGRDEGWDVGMFEILRSRPL